jgi:signal transduction histidine kinase
MHLHIHPEHAMPPDPLDQPAGPSTGSTADAPRVGGRIGTREALRFLAEVGARLASTLEFEPTLQALADLAVPRVACFCVVDTLEEDARVRRLAMAHVDPEQMDTLERIASFPRAGGSAMDQALLTTGKPMLVAPVTEEWLREAAPDAEQLALMRRLAATSLMLVPLLARGRALGMLVLGSTRTDRYYRAEDLALAGELGRIAAISIDNSRLYRQAQDAVRARDEVLRVVSHDLRNPVNVVLMGAAFLLEEAPAELRQGPFGRTLRAMQSSADRADRMINDLLDVSQIEAGQLSIEPVRQPVVPLLREAVDAQRAVAESHRIDLRWRAGDDLPRVLADGSRVLQILGNLVTNALKFTPAGGVVEVGAVAEGEEIRWYVSDTGPGMAPEQLPHVFDRFWQAQRTDRRGLGLGLAIVLGLAQAHGGRVWVESELGRGTTFHFTLPLAPEPSDDEGGRRGV